MFPVELDLSDRLVVLVGAGRVGRRKLGKLLAAGARTLLIEPRPSPELREMIAAGQIQWHERFQPSLLEGAALVFAASDDRDLNEAVAREARARGLWVNVADAPRDSDFFLPAVVERGPFRLTVSTGGASPALAARVAARLREEYGPEYGRLTRFLAVLRPWLLSSGLTAAAREDIFKRLANSAPLQDLLARGRVDQAVALVNAELKGLGATEAFTPPEDWRADDQPA